MSEFLEVRVQREMRYAALDGERVTLGRAVDNDVAVPEDGEMSRLHAVIEKIGGGWCISDISSKNGTFVNGERILTMRALRPGDEIRTGSTRMIFRTTAGRPQHEETKSSREAPQLTARERDVLVALFGRATPGDVLIEPASTREVAMRLRVSEAAVKQHLLHLYDKFGLIGATERNRARLANEALRRGMVTAAELEKARSAPG